MDGTPFMPAILGRIAPRIGATVLLEPEFRIVGRIEFPNGRRSLFWHNKFNLNPISSVRIAQDKGYTAFFLERFGFRVPRGQTFFRDRFRRDLHSDRGIAAACRYAETLGWPVYVKPCRGSQGLGIELVRDARQLRRTLARRFRATLRTAIVQERCVGRDYRLVVLDGRVISAYERVPLTVVGDGLRTIRQLLADTQHGFDAEGRDTQIDRRDPRIRATLRQHRLQFSSILKRGRRLPLLEVANLSCGGTTIDLTGRIHRSVAQVAARVAAALDLRLAGVDLICADATRSVGRNYYILEVNSAPGLDHYGSHGPAHEAAVDALYAKVLRAIRDGPPRHKARRPK